MSFLVRAAILTEAAGNENVRKRHMKMKEKLKELQTWYIHKQALRNMKRRYRQEVAALKISEKYLTDLIIGYPQEDSQRSKWRDSLVQTQRDILNLEMLLKFLNKTK